MQEFEQKLRDLINTKQGVVIDGKVYELHLNIARTINKMESGDTVRIPNDEKDIKTIRQYIHAVKKSKKVDCRLGINIDTEKKVTFINKY